MRPKVMLAIFAVVTLAVLLTGCANQAFPIVVAGVTFDAEQLAQGQQVYLQNCASCHGINGEGQFPEAPTMPDATGRLGAPPHNGNGHTWHHGDILLVDYVRHGGRSLADPANWYPMPGYAGLLSDDQIMLVLAYIKTLWNDEQRSWQAEISAVEAERSNQ